MQVTPNAEKYFNELLILYKPKDIVSGDFYWIEEHHQSLFVAACDGTGHGVPGAFVSIICHQALHQAIEDGAKSTNEILENARKTIIKKLVSEQHKMNDGMDAALIQIDPKNEKIHFSGANNSLWIIRNKELIEIKGDKQPVSLYDHAFPFNIKEEELIKGDLIILTTDGYPDQFGGPKNKKFTLKAKKTIT